MSLRKASRPQTFIVELGAIFPDACGAGVSGTLLDRFALMVKLMYAVRVREVAPEVFQSSYEERVFLGECFSPDVPK